MRQLGRFGNLNRFEVSGGGTVVDTNSVVIRLSGSEPGVRYSLLRDGQEVKYVYGEDNPWLDDLPYMSEYPEQAEELEAEKQLLYREHPIEFKVREPGYYQIRAHKERENVMMSGYANVRAWSGGEYAKDKDYTVHGVYVHESQISDPSKRVDDITYSGAGDRILQVVEKGASPSGKDIVQPFSYGKWGREEKRYLPFEGASGDGIFHEESGFVSCWSAIYGSGEGNYAYSSSSFEQSPTGRVVTEQGPGKAWHDGNKKMLHEYGTNAANEVRRWKINGTETLAECGYYLANSLYRERTTDEDGHITESFTDAQGRLIERVAYLEGEALRTSNVYDDLGRLRYVLPPEANARGALTSGVLEQYAYYYGYDGFGRQVVKRLPGCDPVYMVYDNRDRLVLSQDGNQRAANAGKWSYSLYDNQNRVIETGEVVLASASHSGLQAAASVSDNYVPTGSREALQYTTYDDYVPVGGRAFHAFESTTGYSSSSCVQVTGHVTSVSTRVVGTEKWLTSTTYYDDRGQVVQTIGDNYLGYKSRTDMANDFRGNLVKSREAHGYSATSFDVLETGNEYDSRGRLLSTSVKLNNGTAATNTFTRDGVGRLVKQKHGSVEEILSYNMRGWLTGKESTPFKMKLRYESPQVGTTRLYSGNISEWEWQQGTNAAMMYRFSYDDLNRLKGSVHYQRNGNAWSALSGNNAFNESGLTYDKNGNILTLTRTGSVSAAHVYAYTGNRLTSLSRGNVTGSYQYDKNGNLVNDSRKNLNLTYNVLNLLSVVKTGDTPTATYSYLADGARLGVVDGSDHGFCYLGSLTYVRNGSNVQLESGLFAGGRILANASTRVGNEVRYFLTDHLGSVRVIVDQSGAVKERNDYYPFGGRYAVSGGNVDAGSRWKYNGKEDQVTGGLGWLDYGARMYDWELGRWFGMDLMAEKYNSWSPYNYALNAPIRFIDPNGMWVGDPPGFLKGWNQRIEENNNNFWGWLDTRSSKPGLLLKDLDNIAGGIINFLADVTFISTLVNGQNKTADALGNVIHSVARIPSMSSEELGSFTASSVLFLGEFAASRKLPIGKISTLKKVSSVAKKGGNAFRYMTEGELKAIQETGLLRGGRSGETFFTKDLYKTAVKAQNRLALPTSPSLRVEFQILNNPTLLRNGTKVLPANGMMGKGSEFMTLDIVKVRLINWQHLK
ncbi:RHS repeat domain-containing protein [Butyricimonas synergistica]|uniref:RHS repeat domain-containing protein n=1 Tax=Butyricimonas synergistica TaxID=544644 RepID=UPI0022E2601C|nr:DUF6443 domain-containing protein [Butyricimonas synergistica]